MNYHPSTICWISIPLIFVAGQFATRNQSLDIQLHDTYYAVAGFPLGFFISLVMGAGFRLLVRFSNKGEVSVTLDCYPLATIGGFVLLLTCRAITSTFTDQQSSFPESFQSVSYGISIALLSILLAQPIYLLNLAIGLYRNTR